MTAKELQDEELEVLQSIYEGDPCFKEVGNRSYQYKIGEDGHFKSFLVEVKWTDNYPDEMPNINLDAFYNKHILSEVKSSIVDRLKEEADVFLGSAVTYTLFEYAKENAEDLTKDQLESVIQNESRANNGAGGQNEEASQKKEKREQLSKAQKRKMTNRLDNKGEKPRGWNWIDVVKHLAQTGRSKDTSDTSNTPAS